MDDQKRTRLLVMALMIAALALVLFVVFYNGKAH